MEEYSDLQGTSLWFGVNSAIFKETTIARASPTTPSYYARGRATGIR